MLTFLGYGIVITFMVLIMTKKMSAMTSLILIPVAFALIGGFSLEQIGKFCKVGIGMLHLQLLCCFLQSFSLDL